MASNNVFTYARLLGIFRSSNQDRSPFSVGINVSGNNSSSKIVISDKTIRTDSSETATHLYSATSIHTPWQTSFPLTRPPNIYPHYTTTPQNLENELTVHLHTTLTTSKVL